MAIECMTSMPSRSNPALTEQADENESALVFDSSKIKYEPVIPKQFVWPDEEKPGEKAPELQVPCIDLIKALSGDGAAAAEASRLTDEACRKHGFFVVVNHGIDAELIREVHKYLGEFFELPLAMKQRAQRKVGENYGYTSSFVGRFFSRLPWKETLSLRYSAEKFSNTAEDYVCNVLGEEFTPYGKVFQEYSEAMSNLALRIMELLELSLGISKGELENFFEGNDSILRLNYYPPCQKPDLTLGTGPHCDPTSLTILHQQEVTGLQVFVDNQWQSISPDPDSFVINIGDTLMALSNGLYKSCLHRAVVNSTETRESVAFFLCPKPDKVVVPPRQLVEAAGGRLYPDFTWRMLLEFTQKRYRADMNTLDAFSEWVIEQKNQVNPME